MSPRAAGSLIVNLEFDPAAVVDSFCVRVAVPNERFVAEGLRGLEEGFDFFASVFATGSEMSGRSISKSVFCFSRFAM